MNSKQIKKEARELLNDFAQGVLVPAKDCRLCIAQLLALAESLEKPTIEDEADV